VAKAHLLSRFEELYALVVADHQQALPTGFRDRLRSATEALQNHPTDSHLFRDRFEELLRFLISQGNQVETYRVARDFFLTENEWEMDWSFLPESLEDLLFSFTTGIEENRRVSDLQELLRAAQSAVSHGHSPSGLSPNGLSPNGLSDRDASANSRPDR
jgi:hypothetical protein